MPVALAALGAGIVMVTPSTGTDLAAQHARAAFAAAHPWTAVDLRWFGGVQPAAYSVISPYVMALLGVRLTGVLAAVASAALFPLVLIRWEAERVTLAASWAAVVFVLDIGDGRITFALGLAIALAALVLVPGPVRGGPVRGARGRVAWRWVPCLVAAGGCALTSPVAAVFLAFVALAWAVRRRAVALLAIAAVLPLGLIDLLFHEPGRMPDTWATARPDLLAAIAVVVLCRGLVVRLAALGYGVAVLIVYLDPGPVGSNIERLALLFTGPALICCWRLWRPLLVIALVVVGVWTTRVPIRDLSHSGQLATELAASHRLVGDLAGLGPMTGRVEVVPFRNHGEAQVVGDAWPLARGWERQVDTIRAATLYDGPLTPARYLSWLRANSVQYVALGRHAHDFGALHELGLLRDPPAYLAPVHVDPEWTVWRVLGSTPIVAPPATLVQEDPAALRIATTGAVTVSVNVRWTRWWQATGDASVTRSGDRLALHVPRAETVTLSSSYP